MKAMIIAVPCSELIATRKLSLQSGPLKSYRRSLETILRELLDPMLAGIQYSGGRILSRRSPKLFACMQAEVVVYEMLE